MEANEPAFILATSGTTAKPKLAVHTHGGYQVGIHAAARVCFGLRPTDVWWSTSDIGWIVGHSYMIYAPLIAGCTTVAFEGALDHPKPDSHWRVVVEELGATGIFTSPTAVRMLMRYGEPTLGDVDHRRLERVVCAGEVLNPHAWDWLQNRALKGRVPVIDHMWQTETGGPVFGNPYGIELLPIKPGSAALPLPGIDAAVVNLSGWRFSNGVAFTFPPDTYLERRSYLVVCADEAAVREKYGITNTIGNFQGRLNNDGEVIELDIFGGGPICRLEYNDRHPWPHTPDGTGHTLALRAPLLDLDRAASWTASPRANSTNSSCFRDSPRRRR